MYDRLTAIYLLFFRLDNPNMFTGGDSWGEEVDYYNDQPGKRPPSPSDQPPQYSTPNNLLVSSYISKSVCVLHMVQPIHAEEVTLKNVI